MASVIVTVFRRVLHCAASHSRLHKARGDCAHAILYLPIGLSHDLSPMELRACNNPLTNDVNK